MLTKVKGKVILNKYRVESNLKEIKKDNKLKTVYTARPTLVKESNIIDWHDICKFNGEFCYNKKYGIPAKEATINISRNESVSIDEEIFRADLNELHLFTNKIVKEIDKHKGLAEEELEENLAKFNEQMIESNERLLSYCKLHKLNPRETDSIELFKLVYGHSNYTITDGVMKETNLNYYVDSISTLTSTVTYNDSVSEVAKYAVSGTVSHKHAIY